MIKLADNGNFFNPMYDKSKIYGQKLDATDYSLKFYDKQIEVEIHSHKKERLNFGILRYEKEAKHIRYVQKKGNPINKICSLMKKDYLQMLANDLLDTFSEIKKDLFIDMEQLGIEELKKYSVLHNKKVSKHLTKRSPRSTRSYRNDLISKIDPHFYSAIEQLISAKLTELIH